MILRFFKEQDPKTKIYRYQCKMYLGGKEGDRIYYGKPIIYDKGGRTHFMYPNEARLRNMTYAFSIHFAKESNMTVTSEPCWFFVMYLVMYSITPNFVVTA